MKTNIGQRILVLWIILGAAVCAMPAVSHAATIYDDALGYWNFDDGTAGDATANDHDGTVNGATWTSSGALGGAYSFDGTNDNIYIPNSGGTDMYPTISSKDAFTLGVWLKALPHTSESAMIVDRWPGQFVFYHYVGSQHTLSAYVGDNNVTKQQWNNDFGDDAWHYYMITYDKTAGVLSLFRDGVTMNAVNSSNDIGATTTGLTFGSTTNGPYDQYKGLIDEVAIWDRALSIGEVDAAFKAGYISTAIQNDPELQALGYTTDQINQLANLYYEGKMGGSPASLPLGEYTWLYYDELPGYTGQSVGTMYEVGGSKYLVLGSGLGGTGLGGEEGGGAAPEPVTVVALLAGALMGGLKVARKGMGRRA